MLPRWHTGHGHGRRPRASGEYRHPTTWGTARVLAISRDVELLLVLRRE
jgi:hypothetical protein